MGREGFTEDVTLEWALEVKLESRGNAWPPLRVGRGQHRTCAQSWDWGEGPGWAGPVMPHPEGCSFPAANGWVPSKDLA